MKFFFFKWKIRIAVSKRYDPDVTLYNENFPTLQAAYDVLETIRRQDYSVCLEVKRPKD